jgi:hypothetical protein
MGARDYDARLAAFLEPDPLFLLHPEKCVDSPIECSLYGYARARPLDYTDPTGLDSYLVTVQPGRLVGIDFRLDRATHEFSLRLDLFMEKGSPSVPSFAAGWTSRGLLHDELSIFGRVEAGERIGDLNLLYGQADARIGTAGVKFDGSVSSVPGRVGFSYQRHDGKTEKRRYEDIAPRGAFPERDPAEFKSQPRRLRYGVSASINSREIRTLPARVDAAINKWWSNWDWQVRQMILGQHGF